MLRHLSLAHASPIAAVGFNPGKRYGVPPAARVAMLEAMLREQNLPNVRVALVPGLVWRWCAREGAERMYRGVRTWARDGAAERLLLWQNTFFPVVLGPFTRPIPTVFLEGDPRYNHISSTLVRDLCKGGGVTEKVRGELAGLVGEGLVDDVVRYYG
jgi:pantetheine-phosphate adenylyltransferase